MKRRWLAGLGLNGRNNLAQTSRKTRIVSVEQCTRSTCWARVTWRHAAFEPSSVGLATGDTDGALPFTDFAVLPSTIQFAGNHRPLHAPQRGMLILEYALARTLGTHVW